MNININLGAMYDDKNIGNKTEDAKSEIVSQLKQALEASGLSKGDIFDGRIQNIIGNTVKINLANGVTMTATLDASIDFNIGEDVTFKVKSNDGNKILLQPVVKENINNISKSILNSLEMSGFALTERNISMVKEMMSYGMPIDTESLAKMEKYINTYTDAEVEDIVSLASHNIPVSEENLTQFQNYKEVNYQIADNIAGFTEEFLKTIEDTNDKNVLKDLLTTLNSLVNDNMNIEEAITENRNNTFESVNNVILISDEEPDNVVQEQKPGLDLQEKLQIGNNDIIQDGVDKQTENIKNSAINTGVDIKPEKASNIQTPDTTAEKITMDAQQEVKIIKDSLKELVSNLKDRWIVKPEENEGKTPQEIKKYITEKMKNLCEDAEKMLETFKENGLEKTDLYKNTQNIKNNMNFMNDLNNLVSYIQIPFKTHNGEANGELFVYKRNKEKQENDGLLTAFLHLDMEHLGATDVKVVLDQNTDKVHTGFTIADAASQKLVEENLHLLQKRLEEQGYTVEVKMENVYGADEDKKKPFERVLDVEKPKKEIRRYSFDIRL